LTSPRGCGFLITQAIDDPFAPAELAGRTAGPTDAGRAGDHHPNDDTAVF
jgi:hypothetical protein